MTSTFLQEEARIDVFLSDTMANRNYPYRMQAANEASPTTFEKAEKHILDSSINEDFDNHDVIEKAEYLGAKTIVPADVIDDHQKTLNRVKEMMELAEDNDKEVVVPIQGKNAKAYEENAKETQQVIEERGEEYLVDRYGVGGMKNDSVANQIEYAEKIYSAIGEPVHIFGAGMSKDWVKRIRENDEFIKSIDMATPAYYAKFGKFVSYDMDKIEYKKPRGKHVTFADARLIEAMMTQYNYMISDGPDEDQVEDILDYN